MEMPVAFISSGKGKFTFDVATHSVPPAGASL
jgi:hypothetical protein